MKTKRIPTALVFLIVILAISMLTATAQAITGNPIPDGNKHPYENSLTKKPSKRQSLKAQKS